MKNLFVRSTLAVLAASAAFSARADVSAFGPGEDYYRQFTYAKETTDDGDGDVKTQYRFLMGQSEVPVSDLKKIMVTAELYFIPGGQDFVASYSEMIGTRATPTSEWQYMPNMDMGMCPKVLKGTWSAPVDKLVLSTPAIAGDRATYDTRNAVKLLFNEKLASPEVKGTEIVLDYGYSNSPIEMNVGRGGFCPY